MEKHAGALRVRASLKNPLHADRKGPALREARATHELQKESSAPIAPASVCRIEVGEEAVFLPPPRWRVMHGDRVSASGAADGRYSGRWKKSQHATKTLSDAGSTGVQPS
jgi:hypothetical protein